VVLLLLLLLLLLELVQQSRLLSDESAWSGEMQCPVPPLLARCSAARASMRQELRLALVVLLLMAPHRDSGAPVLPPLVLQLPSHRMPPQPSLQPWVTPTRRQCGELASPLRRHHPPQAAAPPQDSAGVAVVQTEVRLRQQGRQTAAVRGCGGLASSSPERQEEEEAGGHQLPRLPLRRSSQSRAAPAGTLRPRRLSLVSGRLQVKTGSSLKGPLGPGTGARRGVVPPCTPPLPLRGGRRQQQTRPLLPRLSSPAPFSLRMPVLLRAGRWGVSTLGARHLQYPSTCQARPQNRPSCL
jgi:hypothetical protein